MYSRSNNYVKPIIISLRHPNSIYEIPTSVTSISDFAFSACFNLISVTIPTSVTSIGDSPFYGCSNLLSITIPSTITSIGKSALSSCANLITIFPSFDYDSSFADDFSSPQ